MILNQLQIMELTGKAKWTSQARELTTMGIPYRRRSNGSVVVLMEDLNRAPEKNRQASPKLRLSAG